MTPGRALAELLREWEPVELRRLLAESLSSSLRHELLGDRVTPAEGAAHAAEQLAAQGYDRSAELYWVLRQGRADLAVRLAEVAALHGVILSGWEEGTIDAAPPIAGWRRVRLIATGRYAAVYEAQRSSDPSAYALKVLKPTLRRDPAFILRFLRETRRLASVEHPALVRCVEFGEEHGEPYLVMPRMAGSLAGLQGFASDYKLYHLATRVLAALAVLHGRELVHRDVSPGNVLLDANGMAYLADLGLAVPEGRVETDGTGRGTRGYSAPELNAAAPVGAPADIYSVGALLYACRLGDAPDLVTQEGREAARSAAPEWLAPVLERATTTDPSQRFVNAEAMARAIDAAWSRRRRVRPPLSRSGVLVLGTAVLGIAAYQWGTDVPRIAWADRSTELTVSALGEAPPRRGHVLRVGVLRYPGISPELAQMEAEFLDRLETAGQLEVWTLPVDTFSLETDIDADALDAIWAPGTTAAQAARTRWPDSLLVTAGVTDPVASGLAATWERVGAPTIIVSDQYSERKVLDLVARMAPGTPRFRLLYDPSDPLGVAVARRLDIDDEIGCRDLAEAFARVRQGETQDDVLVVFQRAWETRRTTEVGHPVVNFGGEDPGALVSVRLDFAALGTSAAEALLHASAEQADVSTWPVLTPEPVTAVVHASVAQRFGYGLPEGTGAWAVEP